MNGVLCRMLFCFVYPGDLFDTRKRNCSLTATLSAANAAHAVRAHWSIENSFHSVRDVAVAENVSRIRRNPGLFALLRSFALNLLRFNGVSNISLALYDKALNFDRLLAYQGL